MGPISLSFFFPSHGTTKGIITNILSACFLHIFKNV